MPKDINVVEIGGKKYVAFDDLYNTLAIGMIVKVVKDINEHRESDVILLSKFSTFNFDKWVCVLLFSNTTTYPSLFNLTPEELENTAHYKVITYAEYLDYLN